MPGKNIAVIRRVKMFKKLSISMMLFLCLLSSFSVYSKITDELEFTGYLDSTNNNKTHTISLSSDGTVTLNIAFDSTLSYIQLQILDTDGTVIAYEYPSSGINYGPYGLKAGSYNIRVSRFSGYGNYTLKTKYDAQPLGNDSEPNDQISDAKEAPNNGTVTGHLGYTGGGKGTQDTIDIYKVILSSDGAFTLNIAFDSTLKYIQLYILDADGTVIDYESPSSGVNVGPYGLKTGTYYIRITMPSYGGYGGYTLTTKYDAQPLGNDSEPNDQISDAKEAPNNGTVTGHLGYTGGGKGTQDTIDIYKIVLNKDVPLTLNIAFDSALSISYLQILDINGTVVASKYSPSSGVNVGPYGLKTGTYYIKITMFSYGGYGGYTLATILPAIVVSSPNGGETWDAGQIRNITWTTTGTIANIKIEYSTNNGSSYSTVVASTTNTGSYPWTVPNTPSATCLVRVSDAATGTPADVSNAVFSIVTPTPPSIRLSKLKLNFGANSGGMATASQLVIISNGGGGTLNWTAVPQSGWITVTPAGGTGLGTINIGINPSGMSSGTYSGTISVVATGATNSPQTLIMNLQIYDGTNSPIGVVDTPADGTVGIEGSVPVTGWVVDDIGVGSVKIYRDPVGGEGSGPNGYIYIGDAVFVEGARPDVEQAYPNYPMNYKAGWGYMMLTNFLPNGGNGTFRIHAIATDVEGNTTLLGSKTITCDNAHAVLPFGAIDVPSQGGTASGSTYINYAWVLTPVPKMIPTDGSTITAWVDGLPIGHPSYGYYRVDIATLFPGYANANGAIGFIQIDTTKYPNGVHTIVWSATDSAGVNNGFGSRYFTIQNAGSGFQAENSNIETTETGKFERIREFEETPIIPHLPIYARQGFDKEALPEAVYPDERGQIQIEIRELERAEIKLQSEEERGSWRGYLKVGDELRPLPIGSYIDTAKGIFSWIPGLGFVGVYEFVFIKRELGRTRKMPVKVTIRPRF